MKRIEDILNSKFFESIDEDIVLETFKEPHLLELARWMKDNKKENNKFYKLADQLNGYFSSQGSYHKNFNDMYKWSLIAFDKLDNFVRYKAGDKKGIKIARSVLDEYKDKILLILNDKDQIITIGVGTYHWYAINRNEINSFYDRELGKYKNVRGDYVNTIEKVKKNEIQEWCTRYDFMIAEVPKELLIDKLRSDRASARSGLITKDNYDDIARKNIERYKKILKQRKADREMQNDTVSKDIKSVLNDILDLSSEIMKNGKKYDKLSYDILSLLNKVYDTYKYNGGKSYGHDGLLVKYKTYVEYTMAAMGGDAYNFQNPLKVKDEIIQEINSLKTSILKIKSLMKAIDEK